MTNDSLDRIKSDLASLSTQQRAELAQYLIETLDPIVETDAEDAWIVEVDRRIEQIRRGEVEGKPVEQVFAEMRAKRS